MSFFIINSVDRLISRVCDLLCIFGDLDLRDKLSFCILDRCQLVYTAKGRAVF